MSRLLMLTACLVAASAQVPQPSPVDAAVQSYWQARNAGQFEETAARRAAALDLLSQTPVDAPQFPGQVQNVAQLYRSGGMNAKARSVIEEGLARAATLGESHPARIQLLDALAGFWQQDGNLLKALSYREKAVAALNTAPPDSSPARLPAPGFAGVTANRIVRIGIGVSATGGPVGSKTAAYQQLADLYRQLGRPDAAAATIEKLRTILQNDPGALAGVYERSDPDKAISLYRRQADQAALNPNAQVWEVVGPLQATARICQQQGRWAEAIAALQDVIARWQASGTPESEEQVAWVRLNLAGVLQQSGQREVADEFYEGLLAEKNNPDGVHFQVLRSYANYLMMTERVAQAGKLLQGYLADHPDLQPWQRGVILFSLADVARRRGDNSLADQYRDAAMELQRSQQPLAPAGAPLIGPVLQKAQAAASQGSVDEAVTLAFQGMDSSPQAPDRDQVAWQVPSVATQIADRNAPAKAEQLYRRLFALVESWSSETVQPLMQVWPQYVRFLITQKDRWAEVPGAIEHYRENVNTAQGLETSMQEQPLELAREFAEIRGDNAEAIQNTDRLLELEASLSGKTSQPYLRVVQSAARVYQSAGLLEGALTFYRQTVAIADAVFAPTELERGSVRISAAFALANARQFDEAERFAGEAVAIGQRLPAGQMNIFAAQAEQIFRMRARAAALPR